MCKCVCAQAHPQYPDRVEPLLKDTSVFRTLCNVPISFLHINLFLKRGHLSIQDTSPGPQGVHNRGVPLYIKTQACSCLAPFKSLESGKVYVCDVMC